MQPFVCWPRGSAREDCHSMVLGQPRPLCALDVLQHAVGPALVGQAIYVFLRIARLGHHAYRHAAAGDAAIAWIPAPVGVIRGMKDAGCDAVILGCTEIPLIVNDSNSPLPTLDSTRLLAWAAL